MISFTALSHIGLLEISGQDAKKFLQGQITCDLDEVTPTQSQLGAHCDLKGRMQSLFRIALVKENHYFLSMPLEMIPLALQNFKKYALFSKVYFNDASSLSKIGMMGQEAPALLAQIKSKEAPIIYTVPGPLPRYEIYASSDLIHALLAHATSEIHPWETWELLDIQQGLPTVYPATMHLFLPHHANFSILGGISYTKGCYLGQEIIARMHYRGKIKKHMYRVGIDPTQTETRPSPGTSLSLKGENVGLVVRATQEECLVILDNNDIGVHRLHLLELPYTLN